MPERPEPVMICATCRRTLDVRTDITGVGYQHTLQDADDHQVVPVYADPQWRGRCDFCNEDNSTHVIPARDFTMPTVPGAGSFGSWSACTPCTLLVESNRWSQLVRRASEAHERLHGGPIPEPAVSALRTLYRKLRQNVTGSPIELPDPGKET